MSQVSRQDLITVGKIVGSHGVTGEVRVVPLTDFPDRFLRMETMDLYRKDGKSLGSLTVENIRTHVGKGMLLVRFAEVTDLETAEALRDSLIRVAPEERVDLPEGHYWIDDIIGREVIDGETGQILGKVSDVIETGSNDVYMVRTPEGAEKAIPAVRDVILVVNLHEGTMKIRLPEGLWD